MRVFNRSGKPASLSKPGCDDTETETETEASRSSIPWPSASSYFRSMASPSSSSSKPQPLPSPTKKAYEIDSTRSSSVPRKVDDPCHLAFANVHLESVHVKSSSVTGTVLVRNIAYEKQVAVRFTLDDWQTTSEVSGHHHVSLPRLPDDFLRSVSAAWTIGDLAASTSSWDRFTFTINLEDYALNLDQKTMWLVVRYSVPPDDGGCGEWWDNCSGGNYRIGFKAASGQIPKLPIPSPSLPIARSSSASAAGSFSHQKFHSYPHSGMFHPIASLPTLQRQRQIPHDDEADYAAHQAAVAQTTLSRLKKLNLRNYAAPIASPNVSPLSSRRPSVSVQPPTPSVSIQPPTPSPATTATTGSPDSLSNSSSSSSADTTPVSSPKTDFLGLGFVSIHDLEFGIEMGVGGMEFHDGAPATHVQDWNLNLSTSPPFSMLSGAMKHRHPPPPAASSQPESEQHHPATAPATIAATQNAPSHPPRRVRRPPSPPPRSSWVRSIGTLDDDEHTSSSEAETVKEEVRETEGVEKNRPPSPTSSSSSLYSSLQRPPMMKSSPLASLLDVIKEKSTSPGRHLHGSGSGSGSATTSSSSGSSSSDSDDEENDDGVIYTRSSPSPGSPRGRGVDPSTPTPTRSLTPIATQAQAQPQTDSVYQAFVKQWCFAHGGPGSPGVTVR